MTELLSQQLVSVGNVLLQELSHRINNEFTSVISAISVAAARSSNDDVKGALIGVTELLHHYADVHHALQIPENDGPIDAAAYIHRLCLSISRSKLAHRKITLVVATQPLSLQSERCWRLGLIVYELVSNAARHAFVGKNGEIRVDLSRGDAFVECMIVDNGSGPAQAQPGRGLKIVNELAKSLDGRFEQQFGAEGSKSILIFPRSSGGTVDQPAWSAQSSKWP